MYHSLRLAKFLHRRNHVDTRLKGIKDYRWLRGARTQAVGLPLDGSRASSNDAPALWPEVKLPAEIRPTWKSALHFSDMGLCGGAVRTQASSLMKPSFMRSRESFLPLRATGAAT